MVPICRAERCRSLDRALVEGLGVPGRQLMEVAGREAARQIHARWPHAEVVVFCGSGNNGGDGYVVARWLTLWGHGVRLWASGPPRTDEAKANATLWDRIAPEPLALGTALSASTVAVDALLGTGQAGAQRGPVLEAATELTRHEGPVVALDVCTGLHADTGQVLGTCAAADLTVAFGCFKTGHFAMPGAALSGERVWVDLGFSQLGSEGEPDAWLLEADDIRRWLPTRRSQDAKWDRGHVAVRAEGGAAVLAARGAFAAGAGLVTVLCPRAEWGRLHGLPPEVILAEPNTLDPSRHDVLVLGPALGRDPAAGAEVHALWEGFANPIVGDADALWHLAQRPGGWTGLPGNRVVTPHTAEAGRLLNRSRAAVEADRFAAVERLGPGAVLKGPHTLVRLRSETWVNNTGSVRLATAGTGDVLAGMLGGLWAQGLAAQEAAACAVWLHGRAGERVAANGTASDVVAAVKLEP